MKKRPPRVVASADVNLLWEFPLPADCIMQPGIPNVDIYNFKEHKYCHTDKTLLSEQKSTKAIDKVSKYEDMEIEIKRM